jgi:putative flippase GtrA
LKTTSTENPPVAGPQGPETGGPSVLVKALRFLVVGGVVCGVDFLLLGLLRNFLPTLTAVSLAYITAVSVHYCLNKWWVFESRLPVDVRELARYLVAVLACWLCTVAVVWLMLRLVTANVFLAKFAALFPATVVSFVLMRWFVFPRAKGASTHRT